MAIVYEGKSRSGEWCLARIQQLEKENRDLRVALHNLVFKLRECQPHIDGAFQMAFEVRGRKYTGPNYGAEFSSAKKIVDSASGQVNADS